jgi:hypothetical protein
MVRDNGEKKVLEVEVERLPRPGIDPPGGSSGSGTRSEGKRSVLGPVIAGVLVDLLDAATLTPVLGLALGVPLGLYVAHQSGLRGRAALQLALVIGVYCAVPGTFLLPLGTIIGTWVRVKSELTGS